MEPLMQKDKDRQHSNSIVESAKFFEALDQSNRRFKRKVNKTKYSFYNRGNNR